MSWREMIDAVLGIVFIAPLLPGSRSIRKKEKFIDGQIREVAAQPWAPKSTLIAIGLTAVLLVGKASPGFVHDAKAGNFVTGELLLAALILFAGVALGVLYAPAANWIVPRGARNRDDLQGRLDLSSPLHVAKMMLAVTVMMTIFSFALYLDLPRLVIPLLVGFGASVGLVGVFMVGLPTVARILAREPLPFRSLAAALFITMLGLGLLGI